MTPESKAIDIVAKLEQGMTFMSNVRMRNPQAKQCALIAVDEIITSKPSFDFWDSATGSERRPNEEYWQQVKQAIEKM